MWRVAELLGHPDPDAFFDSLTPEEFDRYRARNEVLPYDHTPKMLGLIAFMLANYLGHKSISEEVCMPWLDQSPAALMRRATGG